MKHSIQSACPVCGASLPHTNPMAREYHENVARRSGEEESEKSNDVLWQRYNALEQRYDELLRQFDLLEKRQEHDFRTQVALTASVETLEQKVEHLETREE